MNNFSLFNRFLHKLSYKLFGKGKVFIGDIDHYPYPIEVKGNCFGGQNIKYVALPGQMCTSITKNGKIVEDEITYFSIHRNIPLYKVIYSDGSEILTSPVNTILIMSDDKWERANLIDMSIVGKVSPGFSDGSIIYKKVVEVINTHKKVDMYDVSLKNETTFLTDSDIFVFDTVSVHVPISDKAVKNAKNMMPSMSLIEEETGKIKAFPDHSAVAGLHILSKTEDGLNRINSVLPDGHKATGILDKNKIKNIISNVAKDSEPVAAKVANKLRELGDNHAYKSGFSLSLSDIEPLQDIKQEAIDKAIKKLKYVDPGDSVKIEQIYQSIIADTDKKVLERMKNSKGNIPVMLNSRARGSMSQFRDIIVSPIAIASKEISKKPIKHAYSEGLSPAEYWKSAHGARRGVIGRAQETALPGALGKELLSTTNTLITRGDKPDSLRSIELPLDNTDDVLDRYTARDIRDDDNRTVVKKDTLINPDIIQKLLKKDIKNVRVYTPLGSSNIDGTIPSVAYGINKYKEIPEDGYPVGAISAFGLVEPLYTGSMQKFHTGSAIEDQAAGYPRLKQLLELTSSTTERKKLPSEATLSTVSGEVESIENDDLGGHNVTIGGKKHYVLPANKLKIKVGDSVGRGDSLSTGPIQPKDLAKLKSIESAQKYMVDEIRKVIPELRRRNAEVIVEGLTRYGKIIDPGDTEYLPGDIDLVNNINAKNTEFDDNPASFEYLFRGVNTLPQETQSWLSKLNFRNLKRVFQKDLITGAEADIHGPEPIPGLAYGVEFGKGKKGHY